MYLVHIIKPTKKIGWGPFVQGDRNFGDRLSRGTELAGDSLSRRTNVWGTICPGGPEVGDRKSRDQIGSGPIALQPKMALPKKFRIGIGIW